MTAESLPVLQSERSSDSGNCVPPSLPPTNHPMPLSPWPSSFHPAVYTLVAPGPLFSITTQKLHHYDQLVSHHRASVSTVVRN